MLQDASKVATLISLKWKTGSKGGMKSIIESKLRYKMLGTRVSTLFQGNKNVKIIKRQVR